MPRIKSGPPCVVCQEPSHAHNFCFLHYERWRATGDPSKTKRPDDWGRRNKHPLNQCWRGTARLKPGRVPAWDDFWAFVRDVSERPSADHVLRRRDVSKPYGPDNCYWAENTNDPRHRADHALRMREYRAKNPERFKGYDLKRNFGITLAQYDAMLAGQNGCCAICNEEPRQSRGGSRLAVDHCHTTKVVRGLLCADCNRVLGMMKDSPERLEAAAAYLRASRICEAA